MERQEGLLLGTWSSRRASTFSCTRSLRQGRSGANRSLLGLGDLTGPAQAQGLTQRLRQQLHIPAVLRSRTQGRPALCPGTHREGGGRGESASRCLVRAPGSPGSGLSPCISRRVSSPKPTVRTEAKPPSPGPWAQSHELSAHHRAVSKRDGSLWKSLSVGEATPTLRWAGGAGPSVTQPVQGGSCGQQRAAVNLRGHSVATTSLFPLPGV